MVNWDGGTRKQLDCSRKNEQARNERGNKLFAIFKGLVVLERHCRAAKEEVKHSSERQEVLTVPHAEDSTRKVSGED